MGYSIKIFLGFLDFVRVTVYISIEVYKHLK